MLELMMLGSGSGGNACIVKNEDTMILIDAGFSGAEIKKRMQSLGLEPEDLEACLITHEHGDHIKGASILSRRHRVKLLMHPATKQAGRKKFTGSERIRHFEMGEVMELGSMKVSSVPTLHDSDSSTGFLIESGDKQLGYLTDLGAVTEDNFLMMRHADFLVMEANHDRDMLWDGPYPPHLKARVDSRVGHLSNLDSAEFIAMLVELGKLRGVMLAHLSEKNNDPALALATVRRRVGNSLEIYVAEQHRTSKRIKVETK
ncbi:MAG: MBL fold metallo-hydrolase [Candidatus Marinimicrobia bacterium]|nr:MBL fold metallo-hydrolase [Candidatus Neomarinimicrobiota bacterium]